MAGVKLILTPSTSAMFKRAGMLAPDGRCKTLDSAADGYVRGEACVSAMLQLVAQDDTSSSAVAYILGSAVNQDGRSSSLTAPNGPAQQGVIRQALQGGAMQPSDVGMLQMHGTGDHAPLSILLDAIVDPSGHDSLGLDDGTDS